MQLTLQHVARALGGEVSGNQVRAPGPGHSPRDRSLSIKLDAGAPGGFVVHAFSFSDNPIHCKDYVREKLGLPPWNGKSNGSSQGNNSIVATYDYTDEAGELLFQVATSQPEFNGRTPNCFDVQGHCLALALDRPEARFGAIYECEDLGRLRVSGYF